MYNNVRTREEKKNDNKKFRLLLNKKIGWSLSNFQTYEIWCVSESAFAEIAILFLGGGGRAISSCFSPFAHRNFGRANCIKWEIIPLERAQHITAAAAAARSKGTSCRYTHYYFTFLFWVGSIGAVAAVTIAAAAGPSVCLPSTMQ